eukprot:jgi/Hompol1/4232/HPOL_006999-RA
MTMSNWRSEQWQLLRGAALDGGESASQMCAAITAGDYGGVLRSATASSLLGSGVAPTSQPAEEAAQLESGNVAEWLKTRISTHLAESRRHDEQQQQQQQQEQQSQSQFDAMMVGIAALLAFVQTSWTGPLLSFTAA